MRRDGHAGHTHRNVGMNESYLLEEEQTRIPPSSGQCESGKSIALSTSALLAFYLQESCRCDEGEEKDRLTAILSWTLFMRALA